MSKGGAVTKKLKLSEDFQEFMGSATASRGDVTKAVWAYIRKHDLKAEKGVKFDSYLAGLLNSDRMARASDLFGLLKKVRAFQS